MLAQQLLWRRMILYEAFQNSEHHNVCFFVSLVSDFDGWVIKLIERLNVMHELF